METKTFMVRLDEGLIQWKLLGPTEKEEIERVDRIWKLDPLRYSTIQLLVELQHLLSDSLFERQVAFHRLNDFAAKLPADKQAGYSSLLQTLKPSVPNATDDVLCTLVRTLGQHLYASLFSAENLKQEVEGEPRSPEADLRKALKTLTSDQTLRIEIVFMSNAEELGPMQSWPWEYIYIPESAKCLYKNEFLATVTGLVMNRRLQLEGIKEISFPADTVRVLVVKSDPPADALGEVMGEVVIAKLEELKTARAIKEVSILREPALAGPFKEYRGTYKAQATFAEFKARMKEKPEVVHFIGHGRRSGGHGQLAFVGEDGSAQWVDEDEFRDTVYHDGLRLVFLQACESALPDPHAPISGLAISLARRGVPAVVAMQAKVKNKIADEFATQFYEALAAPSPVDMAVKVGRDQVRQQLKSANGERFTAFGIPVLFLRSYENLIQVNAAGSRPLPAGRPTEDTQKRPKFCDNCGEPLGPTSNFCRECGKRVDGGRQEPVTAGRVEFVGEAPRAPTVQTEPKVHDRERAPNLGYGESAGGGSLQ